MANNKHMANNTQAQDTTATMALLGIDGNAITVKLDAGNTDGKLSSTGKSMVLVSDKVKFPRADGREVVAQITMYMPVGK